MEKEYYNKVITKAWIMRKNAFYFFQYETISA